MCGNGKSNLALPLPHTIYIPDTETAERLDKLLWTFSSTAFIPHCRVDDKLAYVTPVIISPQAEPLPHDNVLINLHVGLSYFVGYLGTIWLEITSGLPDWIPAFFYRSGFISLIETHKDRG